MTADGSALRRPTPPPDPQGIAEIVGAMERFADMIEADCKANHHGTWSRVQSHEYCDGKIAATRHWAGFLKRAFDESVSRPVGGSDLAQRLLRTAEDLAIFPNFTYGDCQTLAALLREAAAAVSQTKT